jgi:hypothetical protein
VLGLAVDILASFFTTVFFVAGDFKFCDIND